MKYLYVFLIIISQGTLAFSLDSKKFIAIEKIQAESILLILPGAYQEPETYLGVANEIHHESNGLVSVYIARFYQNFANPIQSSSHLRDLLDHAYRLNPKLDANKVFIAGHSQGGIEGIRLVRDQELGGLILWGSYMAETPILGTDLLEYPRPVMTLGGERDGLTGVNFLARELRKSQSLPFDKRLEKPVIVLEGLNHMSFADGALIDDDLSADISVDKAHQEIARHSLAFINYVSDRSQYGREVLSVGMKRTENLLSSFEQSKVFDDKICRSAQESVAGLAARNWSTIDLTEEVYTKRRQYPSFILSKSSIESKDEGYVLNVSRYVEPNFNITDISLNKPLSSPVVGCKLRTQESILEKTSYPVLDDPASCAELNLESLERAISLLTDKQKSRLENRYGVILTEITEYTVDENSETILTPFVDFKVSFTDRGDQWALGSIPKFEMRDGKWLLDTYSFKSSTDAIGNFGGAFYCKIKPVQSFLEWLLIFNEK